MQEPTEPPSDDLRGGSLLRAGLAGGTARLVTVVTGFLSVAVVTRALGVEGYAVYAVITALIALLPFLDIGVGLGLLTELSRRRAEPIEHRQRTIASCYWFLCVLAVAISCGGLALSLAPSLPSWLGLPTVWRREAAIAVFLVILALAIAMPAGVVFKVWLAEGQSARVARWQAAVGPISVALLVLAWLADGGVAVMVAVTVATPVLVAGVASVAFFGREGIALRPRRALARLGLVRGPISLGAVFGIQGICLAGGLQADALILSHIVSDQELASYNIAFRMSAVFLGVMSAVFIPLWAAFGHSTAVGDWNEVRRSLRLAVRVATLLAIAFACLLVAGGAPLIRVWAGADFVPDSGVLWAVAASTIAQTVALPFAMLMNGMGVRLFQVIVAVLMLVANLTLSVVLAHSMGAAGPALASAASVFLFLVIPNWYYTSRRLASVRTGKPAGAAF